MRITQGLQMPGTATGRTQGKLGWCRKCSCGCSAVLRLCCLRRQNVRCSTALEAVQAPHQACVSTQPLHLGSSCSAATIPALLIAVAPRLHRDTFPW